MYCVLCGRARAIARWARTPIGMLRKPIHEGVRSWMSPLTTSCFWFGCGILFHTRGMGTHCGEPEDVPQSPSDGGFRAERPLAVTQKAPTVRDATILTVLADAQVDYSQTATAAHNSPACVDHRPARSSPANLISDGVCIISEPLVMGPGPQTRNRRANHGELDSSSVPGRENIGWRQQPGGQAAI
jgi:hypothetical protein